MTKNTTDSDTERLRREAQRAIKDLDRDGLAAVLEFIEQYGLL